MLNSFFTLALTALLLSSGCAAPRFDAAAESHALLQRDAEWSRVASEGKDVERIVSYWADDAVVIPQGQPAAEGKAAIRGFVQECLAIPGFKIHWVSDRVAFSPDGQLAYMRGNSATTVPGPNGAPITVPGRALTVWRREPDGQWRCVVDIWNDPPAAAAK
jgi:ketosteroid isomerase-like protein